jgi:hypothetical protein
MLHFLNTIVLAEISLVCVYTYNVCRLLSKDSIPALGLVDDANIGKRALLTPNFRTMLSDQVSTEQSCRARLARGMRNDIVKGASDFVKPCISPACDTNHSSCWSSAPQSLIDGHQCCC